MQKFLFDHSNSNSLLMIEVHSSVQYLVPTKRTTLKVSKLRVLSGPHFLVVQRCSLKKAFLKISRNSQGNTCARVPFLIKLQASGLRTPKNTFLQNASGPR